MLTSLKWRHKLLDTFFKSAAPERIVPHVVELKTDVSEYELLLQDPIDEATQTLLKDIVKDCEVIEKMYYKQSQAAQAKESQPNPNKNVKLPKLNINPFDGTELHWLAWWDQFASSVHDNSEIVDGIKVQYLANALQGAAKESTQQFPFVASSYPTIIEYLKTTYGDVVKLRSIYTNAITEMEPEPNVEGQRKNLDNLKAYLQHLQTFTPDQSIEHFLGLILSKFPDHLQRSAYLYLEIKEQVDTVDNVLNALDRVIKHDEKIRSLLRTLKPTDRTAPPVVLLSGAGANAANPLKRKLRTKECYLCCKGHATRNCLLFPTVESRRQVLREKGLCFICLGTGHTQSVCPKKQTHTCNCCKKMGHHVALCYEAVQKMPVGPSQPPPLMKTPLKKFKGIYLPTFTCYVEHEEKYYELRGLFDMCSHHSYINKNVLLQLKATGEKCESSVCVFGADSSHTFPSERLTIRLFNNNRQCQPVSFKSTPCIAPFFATAPPPSEVRALLPKNLSYADTHIFEYHSLKIDLLIGNDFFNMFVYIEGTKRLQSNLVLLNTFFGYVPSGNAEGEPALTTAALLCSMSNNTKPKKIDTTPSSDAITTLFELEHLGIKMSELDSTDELILNQFRANAKFVDGRIAVSWPWKTANPKLNTNFRMALAQLKSLFHRSSDDLLRNVDDTIRKQMETGILEVAPRSTSYKVHYLPHRPLIQKGKLRIVNNASAHAQSSPSLNSLLYKGPSLIKDIVGLLLRFRWRIIAMTADIEKAFHQLVLNEPDRDVVRILWVKDLSKPPSSDNLVILRYARVPFGVNSSPFLLNMSIQELFSTPPVTQIDKEAAHCFYVDNFVNSCETIVDARLFYDRVMERMESIKFNLRDWLSNDQSLYESWPKERRADFAITSILGINWNPLADLFSLKVELVDKVNWTKSDVLSTIASIYDPLGWLTPCLLEAKLFMQKTWSLQVTWSTVLPDDYQLEWNRIFADLKQLEQFSMPRFLWKELCTVNCNYELHLFTDASQKAFCCVVYLVKKGRGINESALIFTKLKLAPKKEERRNDLSIPRLELLGVFLAMEIKTFLLQQLDPMNIVIDKIVVWTDATTVLQWLNSPIVQGTFVHNRLTEIRKHNDVEIRHIRSHHNPADLPTHGLVCTKLSRSDLWWNGPAWLIDHTQWPMPPPNVPIMGPQTVEAVFLTLDVPVSEGLISNDMEKRFTSWYKYIRIFRKVVLFCMKARKNNVTLSLAKLYADAETRLFIALQHKYFAQELADLNTNIQPCPKLNYFLHTDGLIRCKGRVNSSYLPFETTNPILLPRCPLTRVLVQYIHEKNMHVGAEHTLAKIRERFWIRRARPFVKSVIHNCLVCRRWDGGSFVLPPMPALPRVRTDEVSPFLHTAVDLFGPVYIVDDNKKQTKCWVCIFVCLVTRAIHLEVVRNTSGNEFLLALCRFTSRRGLPNVMLSDNGTNFRFVQPLVGPGKDIKLSDFAINKYLSSNSIEWTFIPAFAPWFGGAYERLIRIVKASLQKSFGLQLLNLVEFQTVLCQAEDIMNSRPISYVSSDLMQPLTPNNFLRLRQVNVDTQLEVTTERVPVTAQHLLEGWHKINATLNYFWIQFRGLYLCNLRQFHNRFHRTPKGSIYRPPKVGEIVLIHDTSAPRGAWIRAKIIHLDPRQAVAKILLPNRHVRERSIRMLHPLELSPCD